MEFPAGRSKVAFLAFAFVVLVLASYAGAREPRRLKAGFVVDSVAFSTDGQSLASGGLGGKILLWDVASKSSAARIMAF
jgi:WD40 repeat protein